MRFIIEGRGVHAATGGRAHVDGNPVLIFLHGAGFDHTAWALHSRRFAFHGWNVLAVDLPGHGRSDGPPLATIAALADWVAALVAETGAPSAALVGHSMGSLIALETAARHPSRVSSLVLIGTAASMPVHPDLLAAAAANEHAAIDMVNLWGHGAAAGIGGSRAPGVWMTGAGERVLERAAPGVLHTDLAACNAYRDGPSSAAALTVPVLLICGERDQMTPLKRGRELAAKIARATFVAVPRAGHMLPAERPYEVQDAMIAHLAALIAGPHAGNRP